MRNDSVARESRLGSQISFLVSWARRETADSNCCAGKEVRPGGIQNISFLALDCIFTLHHLQNDSERRHAANETSRRRLLATALALSRLPIAACHWLPLLSVAVKGPGCKSPVHTKTPRSLSQSRPGEKFTAVQISCQRRREQKIITHRATCFADARLEPPPANIKRTSFSLRGSFFLFFPLFFCSARCAFIFCEQPRCFLLTLSSTQPLHPSLLATRSARLFPQSASEPSGRLHQGAGQDRTVQYMQYKRRVCPQDGAHTRIRILSRSPRLNTRHQEGAQPGLALQAHQPDLHIQAPRAGSLTKRVDLWA